MKRIILIFFLAITQIASSQNSFLRGNILLDDGYPAVGANIYIKKLDLGTISDFNGNYSISNIYPNPFNPSLWIDVKIFTRTSINMTVYNLLGEKVDKQRIQLEINE